VQLRSTADGPATISRDQERLRVEDAERPLDAAGAAEPPAVGGAG